MDYELLQEKLRLEKREKHLLAGHAAGLPGKAALRRHVPPELTAVLELAFEKAFRLVFEQGGAIIEKTFDGRALREAFARETKELDGSLAAAHAALRRMDAAPRGSSLAGGAVSAATGFGLGFLGMGLPDIPLLTATLLREVYGTAAAYGFDYTLPAERVYLLRVLGAALATGEAKAGAIQALHARDTALVSPEEELAKTAKILADALLVEKFVQGIPVAGAVGGVVNSLVCRRVAALARTEYKLRYVCARLGLREDPGVRL